MAISGKGVFIDKDGQVVDGPVEEGQQLVAPGGEITPQVQQNIDLAREAAAGVSHVATITSESAQVRADDAPAQADAKPKGKK